MPLNDVTLYRQPLALVGEHAAVQRVQTFLRAAGGTVGSADTQAFETLEALTGDAWGAVLMLNPRHIEPSQISLLLNTAVPVIILSDDRETVHQFREAGCLHFAPWEGISSAVLVDTVLAAQAAALLQREAADLQKARHQAEQRFQDVADQFTDWLWEVDTQLNILFSSSRKRPAQGGEPGKPFVGCFLPEEKMRVEDDFAALLKNPQPFQDRDYWSYDAYGTRMCWAVSGVPIYDAAGVLTGFRGVAKDISTEKSTADKLYHIANNDPVTGLYNRSRFF